LLILLRYYEICLGMICACLPTLPILGKSVVAQRILNSRLFSLISSATGSRSRSRGSTDDHESFPRPDNSSTTRLAHDETHGAVTVTHEFNLENSYELSLAEHGVQKSGSNMERPTHGLL
jgi:hypothetical protein